MSRAEPQARLLRAAEQAKIALSTQPFVQVREEFLVEQEGKPLHLALEVSRQEFEGMIREWIERTLTAFDQALEDAHIEAADLDRILFVGGSTRIPLVWEMVAEHTGKEPLSAINPDEAVALGAGVQAAIIAGEPLDAILVDVTPHSLGIEVAELSFMGEISPDHFAPLIHRNATIPASHAKQFAAVYPDQEAIQVKVYQGEDPVASNNALLGEFFFDELEAHGPDEPPTITVKFDLDLNGILNVIAVDRVSGNTRHMTMKAEHRRMNPAEKLSAAESIATLGAAEATELAQPALSNDLVALLFRARQVLATRRQGATRIQTLVDQIESQIKEGQVDSVGQLSDELLDVLYDLDE
ncbi:MAG: Hsp70 family protein [Anaerolineae bacterium]|nr:Hsp70 family protein [Anaerolineae bacterium]